MSVIETPPVDRLPIETVVRRFNRAVIKEALERELQRGGQCSSCTIACSRCRRCALRPGAGARRRVIMAHGQMNERELEGAMVRFIDGQADVLCPPPSSSRGSTSRRRTRSSSTGADRFGLAQLYQLRGRVGRERQQAFAYLLVPADGRVDEQAQRRLRALQE